MFAKHFKLKYPIAIPPMKNICGPRLVGHAAAAEILAFLAPLALGDDNVDLAVAYHTQKFREALEVGAQRASDLHNSIRGERALSDITLHQRQMDTARRIGVGYVVAAHSSHRFNDYDVTVLSKLVAARPSNIWLSFAEDGENLVSAIELTRRLADEESPSTHIFAQVHTADDAFRAAAAGADALVLRGDNARGPQFYNDSDVRESLTELFPAVAVRIHGEAPLQPLPWSRETLTAPFLIAAGGVRTGENMRWAMEIGFDGVVMGTRFEVCDETCLPEDLVESEIERATPRDVMEKSRGTVEHILEDIAAEASPWSSSMEAH